MKFTLGSAVVLVFLAFCSSVDAQAAPSSVGAVGPPSFCQIHLNILQSQAVKINTPDLPEDLKLRIEDVLESAATGCTYCDNLLIWLNKICLVVNLRSGITELSQIKTEADARAAAAAAAAAATTASSASSAPVSVASI